MTSGTVNLSQPTFSQAMPSIDQNLISPLKIEPNDFKTVGSNLSQGSGAIASPGKVKIAKNNGKTLLEADRAAVKVKLEQTQTGGRVSGVEKIGFGRNINTSSGIPLLTGPDRSVEFLPGQTKSSTIKGNNLEKYGPFKVKPTSLELLDNEVKLQGELEEIVIPYTYERRKGELRAIANIGRDRKRQQEIAKSPEKLELSLKPKQKKIGITATPEELKLPQEAIPIEDITLPTFAQFDGASNYFGISPFFSLPIELSEATAQFEKNSAGQTALILRGKGTNSNLSDLLSWFYGNQAWAVEKALKTVNPTISSSTSQTISTALTPGKAVAPLAADFFKFSYDFSKPETYISIAPVQTRYVGQFSAEGVLIPATLKIIKASALIDSRKNTYEIQGEFGLPWAKDLIVGGYLKILNGNLDGIALKADNLNIPLKAGVFLQRLEGGISKLAQGGFPTIYAGTALTFGKSIDINSLKIPYLGKFLLGAAAGVNGQIYLARADADVGIDASRFGGKGSVKLLGGLLDVGGARFSLNYKKIEAAFDYYQLGVGFWGLGTLKGFGSISKQFLSYYSGTLHGQDQTRWANGGLQGPEPYLYDDKYKANVITLGGSISLSIPRSIPKIGGKSVGGANAFFKLVQDDISSNDYISVWADVRVLPDIGARFGLDGTFELYTGKDVRPLRAERDNERTYVDQKLEEELKQVLPSPFKSSRLPLSRTVEVSLPEAPAAEAPEDPALEGFGKNAIFENAMGEAFNPLDTPEETDQIDEEVAEITAIPSDDSSGEEITPTATEGPLSEEPDAELVPSDETEPSQEDEDEADIFDVEAANNSEVTYGVTGGKYFMFTVSWENSAPLGSVPFEVIGPDGTVYSSETIPIADTQEEYTQPWKVGILGELSDDKQLTILVREPEIGEWTLSMTDTDTLGALEYGGSLDAPDPTILFNDLDFDPTTNNVNINYQAADPDSEATVTFFYDKDGTGTNGTPISEDLVESDGQGNFTWNVTDFPSGEYYIYAMLQDNDNAPRFVYAPNPVKIVEEGSLEQVKNVTASSVGDDTVLVSWEPVEGAVYYIVDYDDNAAGSEIDPIEDTTMVVYDDNIAISGLKTGETYRFTVTAVDAQDDNSLPSLPAIAKVGGGSLEDMAPDEDEWDVYATPGTTYTETIPVPYQGSVTLLEAPQGVALNPTTGEFTWDVPTDAYGWYNVRILQTDQVNQTSVYDFDLFAGTPPEAEGDVEIGSTGNDNLTGNGDDDLLAAGAGDDQSAGGDGDDEMYGNGGDDQLLGEAGGDDMQGGQGNDSAFGGADNDLVGGGKGDDKLYGNVGEDELIGGEGNDEIHSGQDDDTAFGNEGSDQMYGDLGNDILAGGKNNDVLDGGAGDDELSGGMDDDTITGATGDDMANGNAGNDVIDGGEGNDELSGGQGNDTLAGGAGDDNLYGDKGNDSLAGGDGNNFLQGANDTTGPEIDTLIGGAGEDYFSLGEGAEPLYSAFGNDDYVLIQNFEVDKDSLLLPGNPESYQFINIAAESNLPAGIGLTYLNSKGEQDLVAILAGVTDTNAFTDNSFIFSNA